ncbi:MAG: hypothetical protein RIB55_10770 [Nitratireductor sp.]
MLAERIHDQDWEVTERLRTVFDCSKDECINIVREVVGARADAVEDDPVTAGGQFAYIHGTRNVRGLFRSKGWVSYRRDNIEGVRHVSRDLKVIYQNVDLAAATRWPQPVSSKGAGSERLIDASCASLFSEEELRSLSGTHRGGHEAGIWYFCVSVDGEDVRAELSLPSGVANGRFSGFIERIFILRSGDWSRYAIEDDFSGGGAAEFEPVVSRK